jgi:hypothetical protein
MALSPNYGWAEPDNSSLVKNGAQDIRALGDAIDTSLWNVGFGQAGKNKIINGDFNIWQRGTTFNAIAGGTYTADRWCGNYINGTVNATQQSFTAGSAPVAGYESQYFMQLARTSTHASIADYFAQRIEDVRTFAGQTVTFSFWAKISTGTATLGTYFTQSFGSGGSGEVAAAGSTMSLTTTWTRFSTTYSVPSISGKTIGAGSWFGVQFVLPVAEGNKTWQIWGAQLEYGSKATPFETATGTLGGELALCQRYYYRAPGEFETIVAASGTSIYVFVPLPVTMRVVPSASTNVSNASYSTSPSTNQWGLVQTQTAWSVKTGTVSVTLIGTQTTGSLQLAAATFSPVPNSIKIVPDRILEFSAEL